MPTKKKSTKTEQRGNVYTDGIYYITHKKCLIPLTCVCYSGKMFCIDSTSIYHNSAISDHDIEHAELKKEATIKIK